MNFTAYLLALGAAVLSHQVTFRVGNFQVTAADVSGAPVHFTFSAALVAAENALAGKTGTVQVGDIAISVTANAT